MNEYEDGLAAALATQANPMNKLAAMASKIVSTPKLNANESGRPDKGIPINVNKDIDTDMQNPPKGYVKPKGRPTDKAKEDDMKSKSLMGSASPVQLGVPNG